MDSSATWFLLLTALAILGFLIGCRIGRRPGWRSGLWLLISLGMLCIWGWLSRNPAVAVQIVPVSVLSQIEGTGGVPIFMLIIGIAWARSHLTRQRAVTAIAIVFGVAYFLRGGMWMLQPTPATVNAHAVPGTVVLQSLDYTCVPAACATALAEIGVNSNEAEMAELTRTRIGTGATMVRAMDGLTQRLAGSDWQVELIDATYADLATLPTPILTDLQFEPSRRHMVTLLMVSPHRLIVADPMNGALDMPREEFERYYRGKVIVFRR